MEIREYRTKRKLLSMFSVFFIDLFLNVDTVQGSVFALLFEGH